MLASSNSRSNRVMRIFGGEHSGHFYFRDNWFADSGMIAFLVCLELLSVENRPLEEMIAEIDPYYRSGEINSRVDSIEQIEEVSETNKPVSSTGPVKKKLRFVSPMLIK